MKMAASIQTTVIQFIKGMPQTELGELMDEDGMPTKIAFDRLNNAVFYKAYQSIASSDLVCTSC
jgi:hypothetical protein